MRGARWILQLGLAAGWVASARGEIWRTLEGESWEGKLSGVFGSVAVFAERGSSRQVGLELLDDAALERVADHLERRTPVAWKRSTSPLALALRSRLQVLAGGRLENFDDGERAEPEIYLVYFGAQWCGPCVRFSPKLLDAYEQLKFAAPDKFELVFVSSDRSSGEQLEYARRVGMTWPILKFSARGRIAPIERWQGPGIPCLVALTRDGEVLFHSYEGARYLGPEHVLGKVSATLQAMLGQSDRAKPGRHRLAVVQHVRAAAGGNAPVKPYLIDLDLRRYRTLDVPQLLADLDVDERGRVTRIEVTPKLEAVLDYQLQQDAQGWLFLPLVEHGRARAQRVQLPLKL
jgi:thiol-disulfide isomerase/thioredoxin